jgi:hypothetical protein
VARYICIDTGKQRNVCKKMVYSGINKPINAKKKGKDGKKKDINENVEGTRRQTRGPAKHLL